MPEVFDRGSDAFINHNSNSGVLRRFRIYFQLVIIVYSYCTLCKNFKVSSFYFYLKTLT